jgi:hypothetical protein
MNDQTYLKNQSRNKLKISMEYFSVQIVSVELSQRRRWVHHTIFCSDNT